MLTYYPKRNMFGAASTSGQVMKNIAVKMFSRGLLGNSPDYSEGASGLQRAQLYGSTKPGRHKSVRQAAGIKAESHPAAPRSVAKGMVPSVLGLGLREAVVALEEKGFKGQVPPEGTPLARGGKVTLTLAP